MAKHHTPVHQQRPVAPQVRNPRKGRSRLSRAGRGRIRHQRVLGGKSK